MDARPEQTPTKNKDNHRINAKGKDSREEAAALSKAPDEGVAPKGSERTVSKDKEAVVNKPRRVNSLIHTTRNDEAALVLYILPSVLILSDKLGG